MNYKDIINSPKDKRTDLWNLANLTEAETMLRCAALERYMELTIDDVSSEERVELIDNLVLLRNGGPELLSHVIDEWMRDLPESTGEMVRRWFHIGAKRARGAIRTRGGRQVLKTHGTATPKEFKRKEESELSQWFSGIKD